MTKLKINRGLIKVIFLTIFTLGIYHFVLIHGVSRDLNAVCADDRRKTGGVVKYILLSIVTLGIYSIIWWCCSAHRIAAYGRRHNVPTETGAASWILWHIFGIFLCGIGPLVALHRYLESMNLICRDAITRRNEEERVHAQTAVIAEPMVQVLAPMVTDAVTRALNAQDVTAPSSAENGEDARITAITESVMQALKPIVTETVATVLSAQEAPAPVETAPVEESPAEEVPVEEALVEEAPVEEAPVEEAPVEEAPVEETPVEEAPVEEVPVEEAPTEEKQDA